ncbi:hypothetical protein F4860DRAFT_512940 [Xylaria cubensis]|nr:hypothetical protein F4860DRAFT_512940 [Xylaria cubensis]
MLTTLSIPTSCLTDTWLLPATGDNQPAIVLGNPHDTDCWPGNRNLGTTISPAVCPDGYVSACDIDTASRRDESETVWACCPSKFHCDSGTWSCVMKATTPLTKTYIITEIDASGNTITTQVMTDRGINAHSIRVAFHSSDVLGQLSNTIEVPTPQFTTSLSTPTSEVGSSSAHTSERWPTGAWIA